MTTNRRTFCSQAATILLTPRLLLAQSNSTAHPDVAAIDQDRILQAATHALTQSPTPLTSIPAPHSPGTPHDFYSEAEDYCPAPAAYIVPPRPTNPAAFAAHRDALLNLSITVSALTSAFVLTKDPRYSTQAIAHLKAWFIDPATSMTPSLLFGQVIPPSKTGRFEGIVEAVHLAEIAQSLPFLTSDEALTHPELTGLQKWFADYFDWLNTSRLAGLARDHKSHHGTSWLLQASALAHLNQTEFSALRALPH